MNIKVIRKILVGLIVISSIITAVFITYKTVKDNNAKVEVKASENVYKPINIMQTDKYKVLTNKNGKLVFNLPNLEFYIINKTLNLYPELSNKQFMFKTENNNYPTNIEIDITTEKVVKWFYSII